MDESWENWPLHMEMDHDGDFLEQCYADEDEFLRDILQQPDFSCESESHSFHPSPVVQNNSTAGTATVVGGSDEMEGLESPGNVVKGNSSNTIFSQHASNSKRPPRSSSPRTYILSFDDSTVIPAASSEPYLGYEQGGGEGKRSSNSPLSSKRTLTNHNLEPKLPRANQGGKKTRSDSQSMDHIIAERKRRQELTERFIALSATIPGLKKTDKASILREAINYVKELQERVRELENRNKKRGVESTIIVEKSELRANEDSTSSDTSSGDCCRNSGTLPEVEARVLEKEVLIEIHCQKQNGIEFKILDQLEDLHLCVTATSVLPFGNSSLGITVVAKMGEAYKMSANDLAKNLRNLLLKSHDPY